MIGCRNGLVGQPPARELIAALIDMGLSREERVAILYELYGEQLKPRRTAKEAK